MRQSCPDWLADPLIDQLMGFLVTLFNLPRRQELALDQYGVVCGWPFQGFHFQGFHASGGEFLLFHGKRTLSQPRLVKVVDLFGEQNFSFRGQAFSGITGPGGLAFSAFRWVWSSGDRRDTVTSISVPSSLRRLAIPSLTPSSVAVTWNLPLESFQTRGVVSSWAQRQEAVIGTSKMAINDNRWVCRFTVPLQRRGNEERKIGELA